ncbi:unnamed protein product [Nyctereutes procyonoides]|uniref:(raccoon dog) hypothetical protein n=1 Tax=Nyctereutes procyonoides TaxID=34880 RepID=A0A811Y289_NYCPR|nr:unnamed protein product [Nyctereutes procyonoides]
MYFIFNFIFTLKIYFYLLYYFKSRILNHTLKIIFFQSEDPTTQVDNDLPVHLENGGTNNILYQQTVVLCLRGHVCSLYSLG